MKPKIYVMAALTLALVLTGLGISDRSAHALCAAQPEDGNWHNVDSQTLSLTRVQLRFICQDQILNGEPYPPGPAWYMHVFGRCTPTDCDWGEVGARRLGTGHIYAFYDQGFARRHIFARMSQYRPGQLWVYTWSDFTDPHRNDFGVHNWFAMDSDVAGVNCSARGSSSIFVANFNNDTVGSPPAPSTPPLHYGPPGARLDFAGPPNSVVIVDSAALGSKAVRRTRGMWNSTVMAAVVGDNGTAPYTSGTYYIEFKAHGAVVPPYLISGTVFSVRSAEDKRALAVKLFAGSYHLREGSSYSPLVGLYDPSSVHFVHIELNLDTRTFDVCINDEVVASNEPFLQSDFSNLHSLHFFAPQTVTEAFPSEYVVDDMRITK